MPSITRPDQTAIFEPIPALASNSSDLSLVVLQSGVRYKDPVLDPWFSADNCSMMNGTFSTINTCYSRNPFSFLGCREQYKLCTYEGIHCSPLSAIYQLQPVVDNASVSNLDQQLQLNPVQKAVYALIWKILWAAQLSFNVGFIARDNLIANDYIWEVGFGLGLSATLPPTQWQVEAQNWMNVALAVMQRSAVNFARPHEFEINGNFSSLKHIVPPRDKEMQELCTKIIAKSPQHMSFSVHRLFLMVGICLFFVIMKISLPKFVAWFQKHSGRGLHKHLEWTESNYFQLQRIAAEGKEIGPWQRVDKDIPILKDAGRLFTFSGGLQANGYQAVDESRRYSTEI